MSSSSHVSVQTPNPASLPLETTGNTSTPPLVQNTTPDTPIADSEPRANNPILSHRPLSPKKPTTSTFELAKSLVLPLVAIIYLTFCYVVASRIVPVTKTGIIDTSPKRLGSVKSGITAINILIVTIGLWPLRSLIDDLKTEEFFRTLHTHSNGVPISTLNGISNPSFGFFETVNAMIHRHCTLYFTAAFIGRFLAIATATLAPAALTIEPVLWDTDVMAFKIGAITRDSVYNVSRISPDLAGVQIGRNAEEAASKAWAEITLDLQYPFTEQGNLSMSYITPHPTDLSPSAPARWITDVIALHPVCVWGTTNITGSIFFKTGDWNDTAVINLTEVGLDVEFSPSLSNISLVDVKMVNPTTDVTNHTNRAVPSDGSVVWHFRECLTGCFYNQFKANIHIDFTGIPTFQYAKANSTWRGAFLVCSPRPSIETHEIRNDGLQVEHRSAHNNRPYTKQGNLHAGQTSLLLSFAFSEIPELAGPSFPVFETKTQASLFFGTDQINSVNTSIGDTTLTPSPLSNITTAYTRLLRSSMKFYVNGKFGTAYVPGRVSREIVVFRSSIPYVVASTLLFAIMTILLFVAHLRQGKNEKFTLLSVAAALDGSEMPRQFAQQRELEVEDSTENNHRQDERTDDDNIDSFGRRLVSLTRDGEKVVLRLEPVDSGRRYSVMDET